MKSNFNHLSYPLRAIGFFVILFCISFQSEGQTKLDSLNFVLEESESDTNKVNTLLELILVEQRQNRDEDSKKHAEDALDLSKEIKYTKGIAESQRLLARYYNKIGQPKVSLQYYSDSQKSFIELGDKRKIASIYNDVGVIYKNQGLFKQSREYYDQSLKIYQEIGEKAGISDIYSNIGVLYRKQGNYERALKFYVESLKIREELGDKDRIAITYGNMGNLYNDLKEYDKALENYSKAMIYFQEVGNKFAVGRLLNNTGNILNVLEEYDKALANYERALNIHTELGNKSGIANSHIAIGSIQEKTSSYTEAMENYETALQIFEDLSDEYSIAETSIFIGKLFTKMKFFDKAFESINNGIEKAAKIGHVSTVLMGYEGLYLYYEERDDFQNSLQFFKKYSNLKDSVFNIDKSKQLAEVETKYEIEKKSQENALLRKDQEVKDQIIRRQNFQNIASIVAIVFVLAFALYLYQNYKEKQRTNQLLTEQNETLSKRRQQIVAINESLKQSEKQLNEANTELTRLNQGLEHTVEERTQELQQANEELDTFLYQSSHALRRPIAQVKGLIQLARMENGDLNKVEAVYEKIDDTSTRMDLMLRKLVMASEINLAKPNPERINFNQVIEESWELLSNTMEVNEVKLDYSVGENIEYEADRRLINIIFNNLLENAILYQSNHRHRDGEVEVKIVNGQSKVKIDITDNGIGISDAVISEIFDLFSIGTDKTKGYGLGLYIVKKAVDKLNGEITVESKEHEYTQFHLTLPLS